MRAHVPLFLLVVGCVEIPPPVVSHYNGNTVSIQGPGLAPSSPPGPEDIALATETCGKPARYASGRMVGEARVELLFICG